MMENILESIVLLLAGMTGVMASLLTLAGMITAIKVVDERFNSWRIRRYSEKVAAALPEDELSDEVAAIITAAVATTLKKQVRVRRVRLFDADAGAAWSSMGRLNIMASHHIARRKP